MLDEKMISMRVSPQPLTCAAFINAADVQKLPSVPLAAKGNIAPGCSG